MLIHLKVFILSIYDFLFRAHFVNEYFDVFLSTDLSVYYISSFSLETPFPQYTLLVLIIQNRKRSVEVHTNITIYDFLKLKNSPAF